MSLFHERAALVGQDPGGSEPVRSICARLDGIPLAIELAAAWLRALPLPQIAAGLDDRLRLLVGGPRGVVRQQTLEASIAWSHDLLDEADRVVFGGCRSSPAGSCWTRRGRCAGPSTTCG